MMYVVHLISVSCSVYQFLDSKNISNSEYSVFTMTQFVQNSNGKIVISQIICQIQDSEVQIDRDSGEQTTFEKTESLPQMCVCVGCQFKVTKHSDCFV